MQEINPIISFPLDYFTNYHTHTQQSPPDHQLQKLFIKYCSVVLFFELDIPFEFHHFIQWNILFNYHLWKNSWRIINFNLSPLLLYRRITIIHQMNNTTILASPLLSLPFNSPTSPLFSLSNLLLSLSDGWSFYSSPLIPALDVSNFLTYWLHYTTNLTQLQIQVRLLFHCKETSSLSQFIKFNYWQLSTFICFVNVRYFTLYTWLV